MRTQIIGLTGGIGSGKSTIAGFFEALGVSIYIADEEAKKILFDKEVIKELIEVFGEGILTNKIPDRKKIAALVFNDQEKLSKLNSIIHPKVKNHFAEWVQVHSKEDFVIKEAAILFETGSYKDCDKVILVTAPKEIRIERVMQRDNVTRKMVLERMANQWDDDKKAALSNYIIENISLDLAREQVVEIYHELKNL